MKLPIGLTENEQLALRDLKETLSEHVALYALSLFGSRARGEETTDSDIDVMIEVEEYTPEVEAKIDDIIFLIDLKHDVFISATIFGKRELEDGPVSESPLYKSVERDGVRL
jgi:predicted nucleotidyltransferase